MSSPSFRKEMSAKPTFSADMAAGSLLLTESRKISRLLLEGVDPEGWNSAIIKENILQKRSPASSIRIARLIRNRLTLMTPELWRIVAESNKDVATQAVLAASVKHGRLLAEFMMQVLARHVVRFEQRLSQTDWRVFLAECEMIDPSIRSWSTSTREKLRQIVFRILAESRYIESVRSARILPVRIHSDVRRYLEEHDEQYVLTCMEATS